MWLNKAFDQFKEQPRFVRLAVPILLGMAAGLGQAPFDLPLTSLIAFAAVFGLLSTVETAKQAGKLGWLFALGYFCLTLQWLVSPFLVEPEKHAWMAPFAVFFLAGGLALFWSAAFAVSQRLGNASLLMLLPLAELGRAYLFTGFPWGMPSYGLVNTWFGQAASWIGPHGLNILFLIIAFAVFKAVMTSSRAQIIAVLVSILGLAALWPLSEVPEPLGKPVGTIRLVQPNAPQHEKWDPLMMPVFFDRALEFTSAEGSPDLIIWPETSLPASLPNADWALEEMREAAEGTPIVFGTNRFDGYLIYNAAVFMDAEGQLTQTYDKHHLVPFGEYVPFGDMLARFGIHGLAASEGRGFSAGRGAELMDLGPLGTALPLICYEAVFPQDVIAARDRPAFLMQITNDAWFGAFSGPHQHLAQARMRAIEQGLPMVRAANTGISALIDEKGRVLNALPLNEAGFIDVSLPRPKPATLYSHTGDLPVALLLTLGLLTLWIKRRRISN